MRRTEFIKIGIEIGIGIGIENNTLKLLGRKELGVQPVPHGCGPKRIGKPSTSQGGDSWRF